jgi:hypothetical protein
MAERQRVVERGQAGCPVEDLIRAFRADPLYC